MQQKLQGNQLKSNFVLIRIQEFALIQIVYLLIKF